MLLRNDQVSLESITSSTARRILDRQERPGDRWHAEYPFADELSPLRSLASSPPTGSHFTMYVIRRPSDGLAVGGFGFFGPPDPEGTVELGYGLVPSARGEGLATAAVVLALEHAREWGARRAAADTEVTNSASRRVLTKSGLVETGRRGSLVLYERNLAA